MSRRRTIIRLSAVLAVVALAKGCGDGDSPTTPPPQPDPSRPATVAVAPATVQLNALGATEQLTAEVRDQNGNAMAEAAVSWASSAAAVATVSVSGLVTGVGEGMATITASAGNVSGSAVVTVMQPVASVEVSPSADTIGLGSTLQLAAEGFDENGDAVESVQFSWESSDIAIATVDASGLVTGVAVGAATITASAGSGQGTAEITVMDLERAALVALYEAMDGPNWVDSENWLTDAPLGEWYGVDTDAPGRVVRLDLGGRWDDDAREWIPHGLIGPIPVELANLTALKRLWLGNNDLSGPIPPELGNLASLTDVDIGANDLTGPIPPELGNLAALGSLHLYGNSLSGPIPPELGGLSNLEHLLLNHNDLSGPIPPELGDLTNLELLDLGYNALSGPIPQSFLQLDRLERFFIPGNEGLCVPGTSAFVAWLRSIEDRDEEESLCNATDVAALKVLYEVTGGTAWTESVGWPGDGAVEDWHGVTSDSLGRVTILDLSRNGLAGRLPKSLGELARMTELRIADNPDLSGRLPLSLDLLSLRTLHYSGTSLCVPDNPSFRAWLSAIPSHEGAGAECAPLTGREILEALYDGTGGPDWHRNENWLSDAPLGEWHGVEVDDQGRVVELRLNTNRLTGPIPRELGDLANMRSLHVKENDLSGPIPPELGNLANLEWLDLAANRLSGPTPPELASLANLRFLTLERNDLSGPIPPELGRLTDLRRLDLAANRLSGPIPPELGDLANLEYLNLKENYDLSGPVPPELASLADLRTLSLHENDLTGAIPPELGGLANLRTLNLAANGLTGWVPPEFGNLANLGDLYLGENELTGPVPPEFGGLTRLRSLALQTNADMSGPLPASLINLAALETLQTGGTDLCATSDAGFLEWLEGVPNRRVSPCEGEPAMAYLVQAVQSREFPVPLVAGEEALLRVFVTAGRDNDERLPPVRASFYLSGALAHVADIPAGPGPIPPGVDEGSLAQSAKAVIPTKVVRPGLEMVVEVDPDGTLDAGLGVAKRIPETGRVAVDVRDMPVFDLTVVPFLWTADPDSAVLETVGGMAADPEGHELLGLLRTLLPVGDLTVTAHEPVLSSSNNEHDLLDQTQAIRVMEAGTGHYMGTMSGNFGGLAPQGRMANFSGLHARVIAHEFGHSFSLPHAPCGGAGSPDPAYPNADGTTGAWGYDFRDGSLLPPSWVDLMSYCSPRWVSDYNFTKALHYRLANEGAPVAAAAALARSLLLWGGTDADGQMYLEPTFVIDAPPALPDSGGDYRLTGRTAGAAELFSLSFAMPETADGDGSSSFVFALPVRPEWAGNLASVTLSGPGGSATLDGDTDLPMTVLLDPVTGQVRAILRDLPQADAAAALAPQAGLDSLEVLFSRGIPGAEAWRR